MSVIMAKNVIKVSVFLVFAVILINADDSDHTADPSLMKYRKMIETINIDPILRNQRLVSKFMKCLLNETPCSSEQGRAIKGKENYNTDNSA